MKFDGYSVRTHIPRAYGVLCKRSYFFRYIDVEKFDLLKASPNGTLDGNLDSLAQGVAS